MHLFDVSKLYGGNAIVSSHLPLAVGMALAQKQKKDTCCFFLAKEKLRISRSDEFAALWEVPLCFCENNPYAMGTAIRYSHSVTQIEKRSCLRY
jgi:TPP-dependent pyruvate/acetoin dehydrogenase alpha subunit